MSYLSGTFTQILGLRIRPIPELDRCIVYAPDDPHLVTLNPSAWLLLELCTGGDTAQIEAEYLQAVTPPLDSEQAREQFAAGLDLLARRGLIEHHP